MEPLMPTATGRSRPWTDHRLAVEGMAWKYRTGAPWAGRAGAVREVELDLQAVQALGRERHLGEAVGRGADAGRRHREDRLGRLIDSTIARVHQQRATLPRDAG